MAKRKAAGLIRRGKVWHIKKRIRGYGRLHESTGTTDYAEAERYLAHRLEEIRRVTVYGERPRVTFRAAARKFLEEHAHLKSLDRSAQAFDSVDPYVGDKFLEQVHDDSLASWVKAEQKAGSKAATINRKLDCIRRVLVLASRKWRHPNGMTWLAAAPLLSRQIETDKRKPYPLSWEEQHRFFAELPAHAEELALFDVNTGLRDDNLTGLEWKWEVQVPELRTSVFVLPDEVMKNGQEFVLVLNRVARSIVEKRRGQDPTYVFTYKGHPVNRLLNTAWKKARVRAGLPGLRVHDLRHTFSHRLRAAGVSLEDRKALMAHKDGDVTTHYSAVDIAHLLDCVNLIADQKRTTILRVVAQNGAKTGDNPRSSTDRAVSV